MGRLQGKVAIVTGGAQGMGAATARIFVSEGARVVIGDIDEEKGRAVADELGAENARFVRLDVRSDADWAAATSLAAEAFGKIDILINNAAMVHFTAIEELVAQEAEMVLAINVIGTLLGVKHVAPYMEKAGRGSIVNISSVDGLRGCNGLSVYTASKWGVRGMSKSLAYELGPRGIRVNTVHPGGVNTRMGNPLGREADEMVNDFLTCPLQRIAEPEEIARATLFVASDDASYMTGAEVAVDGGWSAGYFQPVLPGAPEKLTELFK